MTAVRLGTPPPAAGPALAAHQLRAVRQLALRLVVIVSLGSLLTACGLGTQDGMNPCAAGRRRW